MTHAKYRQRLGCLGMPAQLFQPVAGRRDAAIDKCDPFIASSAYPGIAPGTGHGARPQENPATTVFPALIAPPCLNQCRTAIGRARVGKNDLIRAMALRLERLQQLR